MMIMEHRLTLDKPANYRLMKRSEQQARSYAQ